MAIATVHLRLTIRSRRAVRALARAVEHLESLVADQPWNDDAKAALAALEIMRYNLIVRSK